ncbi:MAG: SpoIIE family protein phosphatase [Ruminiclostridium sp.]|nr:SpoIIE family protein phosphatase [Ruminiclostridium sp.]
MSDNGGTNARGKRRIGFAGKTLWGLILVSLIITLAAGAFAFYLYWASLSHEYRAKTWHNAMIISQVADIDELRREAEIVSSVYDSLSEEELTGGEDAWLDRYAEVYGVSYDKQREQLRSIKSASDDAETYVAMLDTEHSRMVYLVDADNTENYCRPGYWDECDPGEIDSYLNGAPVQWLDKFYGEEKLPVVIYNMDKYGYRVCAGVKLFDAGKYPVMVFCEEEMALVARASNIFLVQYALLLIAVTVIVLIISVIWTKKSVVRPINSLSEAAHAYTADSKDGQRDTPHFANLDIHTGDEIEDLGTAMKNMESELAEYVKNLTKITAEKERVNTELALATRIQADMLPNIFPAFPERSEFNIYASMTPAKEVGGDFYDFFFVDTDHLVIVMADVSGKGVPAAMFMMMAKSMLQTRMISGSRPAEVLTDVNRMICSNNREEMFVTIWLGMLEISTGRLTAVNAGHEYPILKTPDGDFSVIKDKHCVVVGGMEGVVYKDYELKLEPGSKLFVYTDGVPEATNASNELFGMERTVQALNGCKDGESADILSAVRESVNAFVGDAEQFDDLTMLCIEYKGTE